jgi:hypothetical protein
LTEAEEENYDIDPSKIKEEKEECSSSEKKKRIHGRRIVEGLPHVAAALGAPNRSL